MNDTVGPEMTLGAIVTRYPSLARELEHRKLDYCCGGAVTLGQACRDTGLDAAVVATELRSSISDDGPASWSHLEVADLVEHLVDTHHRYLWSELPRLQALLDKVVGVHGDRHPELNEVACCFGAIRADIEPHLMKEERVLFPAIAQLASSPTAPTFGFGSLGNPISTLLREHDELGALLGDLRSVTGDFTVPDDGCASYQALFEGLEQLEADTHLHVHKENNVLFPRVVLLEEHRRS
ncbi:MAG TPA: iron-sulfur cluster repair di-iron protein [Ilumatobacteraceae bacterium]|nr:iron-sulfur cluster repair di-iron protein [Ilumatobacteraceae bacterium]